VSLEPAGLASGEGAAYVASVLAQHSPDVQYQTVLAYKNHLQSLPEALIGCYVSKYIKGLRA